MWLDVACWDFEKPSKKSLGGEGEVGSADKRANWDTTDIPPESAFTIHYITNSGGVSIDTSVPWMIVMASATIARYTLTN